MNELLAIGQVAALLGVAPETVRSWGSRYGIVASGRTSGGHRRFTPDDLASLSRMQELVAAGSTPAAAARAAQAAARNTYAKSVPASSASSAAPVFDRPRRRSGAGGRVLAVPGESAQARGLARAASRLDARTTTGMVGQLLMSEGVIHTWGKVLLPVLRAAGRQWQRSDDGIEVEHVLTEAIIDALRAYSGFLPRPALERPIVLAGAPKETHTLALHVLAAALRENRVPSLQLGGEAPYPAIASAAKRTGATGVFIWQQLTSRAAAGGLAQFHRVIRPSALLVIGGPGWAASELVNGAPRVADVAYPQSLSAAVELLSRGRSGRSYVTS